MIEFLSRHEYWVISMITILILVSVVDIEWRS